MTPNPSTLPKIKFTPHELSVHPDDITTRRFYNAIMHGDITDVKFPHVTNQPPPGRAQSGIFSQ